MKIEMGIGWMPDPDKPGHLVSARPGEYAAEIERLTAENERLRAALGSCQSWIDRWTKHIGNCNGGAECTCGRSAVLFDASDALDQQLSVNSEEGK